ncbi:MAG: phospholipase D-like domain-containing protein [Chloroflexota bacterium]
MKVKRLALSLIPLGMILVSLVILSDLAAYQVNNTATSLVVDAVLYDGYESNDMDEAVAVRNIGGLSADLAGYRLIDGGGSVGLVEGPVPVDPGQVIWLARDREAFTRQFGFAPDVVLDKWPGFSNTGDAVILEDSNGIPLDVLIYGEGDDLHADWSGLALEPYSAGSNFAAEGQILYRMRDQRTGLPVPDTNTAEDWAQSRSDIINGRKVRYPGWDSDRYFTTKQITATGTLTVAVAPDNSYAAITDLIAGAQQRIRLASLTFENLGAAEALTKAAERGVDVQLLLEGGPAGGISDQERYICQNIEAAGGECWFMINDDDQHVADRYRFMHAKYIVVDGRIAAVSSENFSPDSMPDDDKSDGTQGRRGIILILDAPSAAAYLEDVFSHDLDPAHADILRWSGENPVYGRPSVGFVPEPDGGGVGYPVRYPEPAVFLDTFPIEFVQSPENSLRDVDGLLGLIGRAGQGDTLLVQQLSERPFWGTISDRNALSDPNPRLEAYIAAARRGATVRMLLDTYFDDPHLPTSNAATCAEVNRIARAENLHLLCSLANPTLLGLHNKMVLAQIDGHGYVHVGSLNGTELSNKGNREMAIQVQSDGAYAYLAAMFERDMPHVSFLPATFNMFRGPADHLLITEVYYDPPGLDDKEFIEIGNPLPQAVSLAGYSIGDAVQPDDFEDVRVFPSEATIGPGEVAVVSFSASAFYAEFGFNPDYEIVDSSADVPDLIDETGWGEPEALLQLGNSGDEVVLRKGLTAVDVVIYGEASFDNLVPCPLLEAPNKTLERFPYWRDSDSCVDDFRGWPFPSPGQLP